MIIDHEDANVLLDDTVRFYGVPYLPSDAEAALIADTSAKLSELRATPPEDVDFVYIDQQVRMHAAAQVVLDQLFDLVGPGAMGDHIINARAMVDDHFDRATALLETFY